MKINKRERNARDARERIESRRSVLTRAIIYRAPSRVSTAYIYIYIYEIHVGGRYPTKRQSPSESEFFVAFAQMPLRAYSARRPVVIYSAARNRIDARDANLSLIAFYLRRPSRAFIKLKYTKKLSGILYARRDARGVRRAAFYEWPLFTVGLILVECRYPLKGHPHESLESAGRGAPRRAAPPGVYRATPGFRSLS